MTEVCTHRRLIRDKGQLVEWDTSAEKEKTEWKQNSTKKQSNCQNKTKDPKDKKQNMGITSLTLNVKTEIREKGERRDC